MGGTNLGFILSFYASANFLPDEFDEFFVGLLNEAVIRKKIIF